MLYGSLDCLSEDKGNILVVVESGFSVSRPEPCNEVLALWLVGRTIGSHCRRRHGPKQHSQSPYSWALDQGPTESLAQPDLQPVE